MNSGKVLVQGFLRADGFLVSDEGPYLLSAERIAMNGAHDRRLFWVLDRDVAESYGSDLVLLAEMATRLGLVRPTSGRTEIFGRSSTLSFQVFQLGSPFAELCGA